ncbi:MFS transporter [Gordonia desulfuricans]|uniref:MFS transporter n=1 Tax=Gordonia desulfuricans TaxID=89051 RepID=UPI00073E5E06|nr:MFS transporter [Gordonia desulfuricans]
MIQRLKAVDLRSAWLILIACASVSMVVAAMAALNTALADIAIDLNADTGQMTWIADGYTLALAAMLLPAGAIGDRFGRRELLIAGLVVFAIGSLVAIWAVDPTQLIITRIIAGIGAAFIMPTTLSLITSGVPEDKRSLGISIWAAIAGAGAIAGFFVSGILLEFFSWHSIFITFAVSAVVSALLCLTIGTSRDQHPKRFDFIGSIISILAIAGVVFGLLEAPHRGWDDALVLITLIGGLLLAAVFCVVELRLDNKLLDVRLFTNRAFGAGSLAVALQFFASFGAFYLLLQRLQLVFGYSPLGSAFALMPMVLGVSVFALLGNWIAVRFDSLRFVLGGGIFIAGVGLLLIGLIDYDTYWTLAWMLAVCAIGIGLSTAPSTTAIMSNTPLDNQGVGSAVNDTAREIGAAIGIALAGSLLAAGYAHRIGSTADAAREQLTAAGEQQIAAGDTAGGQMIIAQAGDAADRITRSLAEATEVARRLPGALGDQILEGARNAFVDPMNQACVVLGAVLLVGSVAITVISPRQVVTLEAFIGETHPDPGETDPDATDPDDRHTDDPQPDPEPERTPASQPD